MNNTDGQIGVFKRVLFPHSDLVFRPCMPIEGICAREQGTLCTRPLTSEDPCSDEERRCLKSVPRSTHKLLFYKELCMISLLKPTGTESALPLLGRGKCLPTSLASNAEKHKLETNSGLISK